MSRIRRWKWILWVIIVFALVFLQHGNGRRYEKCSTKDDRPGICVVKRYCREASTNPNSLNSCGSSQDSTFCCPVPTTRSAVNIPPMNSGQKTLLTSSSTRAFIKSTTSQPQRYPPPTREKEERRPPIRDQDDEYDRRPHRIPDDEKDRRQHRIPDDEKVRRPHRIPSDEKDQRPYRIPEDDYLTKGDSEREYTSKSNDPKSLLPESSRNPPREFDERRDETRRRPLPRPTYSSDENRRRHRPNSSGRDRSLESSQSPIKFPGSYETSLPHPTVPACGVKPYDLFIAGGEESREHEWPWMTAIFRRHQGNRPNTFLCGGSLINSRYVLSAAHCFVHNFVILPASSFVVRLGSHYLDSGEDYTVANVIVHHNHSGSDYFNDIALVRIASEVYMTDKIAPVCLPFDGMIRESFVGRTATVTGWGDTSFRRSGSRILQHVNVPVVSSEECSAAYSRVQGAAFLARGTDHVICAGLREGGKDACLGDSGGPLMLKDADDRWIVIGIVSLGYKCAEPGYPGVYTRVTHYLNWINSNMKK